MRLDNLPDRSPQSGNRITEVVCANYEIERTELGRRGNRHPARAALVYLPRRRTATTNAKLAAVRGVSRAGLDGEPDDLCRRHGIRRSTGRSCAPSKG